MEKMWIVNESQIKDIRDVINVMPYNQVEKIVEVLNHLRPYRQEEEVKEAKVPEDFPRPSDEWKAKEAKVSLKKVEVPVEVEELSRIDEAFIQAKDFQIDKAGLEEKGISVVPYKETLEKKVKKGKKSNND
jgi:hypothetical protein